MPIDYQKIFGKIREIGSSAQERKKITAERHSKAQKILETHAGNLDYLKYKVNLIKSVDANFRCAIPRDENLMFSKGVSTVDVDATLIAADGSQINPDRHSAVLYCVLNVGTIILKTNSNIAPIIQPDTQLLIAEEDLFENGELLSESTVALRRDLVERKKLLDLAKDQSGQVITLTDGPLGLWESKDRQASNEYENKLKEYVGILRDLKQYEAITAGYVDKPGENLVIKLLEIAEFIAETEKDLKKAVRNLRQNSPLQGVSDRWLYDQLLGYGERSAVFSIQSKSNMYYDDELVINFFYLNVGSRNGPVRVEIPEWVAKDEAKIEALHTLLIKQCEVMGDRPYPYVLHRSHEVALITNDERNQVEKMLALYGNIEFDYLSEKQSAKNLSRGKRSFHL